MSATKQADLAGPGIGTYEEVDKALPTAAKVTFTPSSAISRTASARR